MNKTYSLFFLLIFFTLPLLSQEAIDKKYYEYITIITKADSLYNKKDFIGCSKACTAIFNLCLPAVYQIPYKELHLYTASAWAMANMPDSAFAELENLVQRFGYDQHKELDTLSDLSSLHLDKRWENILYFTKLNEEKNKKIKERITFVSTQGGNAVIFYPLSNRVKSFLNNDSLPFLSINFNNYSLFFRGDSYVASHLDDVKDAMLLAFQRVLFVLNCPQYETGINLLAVESADELKELTGEGPRGGMALIHENTVCLVYNENRRGQFKHEIFHLISNEVWGEVSSRLLNEGSAVYADNECFYDNPIYGITSYILQAKKIFSLESLINDFDNKAIENEVIAYLQAAAIFKYLYEKYGVEKMKLLWLAGFDKFETIYGISISQFEKEWTKFISTIQPSKDIDWSYLMEEGCG